MYSRKKIYFVSYKTKALEFPFCLAIPHSENDFTRINFHAIVITFQFLYCSEMVIYLTSINVNTGIKVYHTTRNFPICFFPPASEWDVIYPKTYLFVVSQLHNCGLHTQLSVKLTEVFLNPFRRRPSASLGWGYFFLYFISHWRINSGLDVTDNLLTWVLMRCVIGFTRRVAKSQ